MQHITQIAVFCGSYAGLDPAFVATATALGQAIAASGRTLVYGGSCLGLMGAVADAALAAGGRVVGVVPRALLTKEVAHAGLSELVVVESMNARKAEMAARADAFVAMAGGLGTLDELFEIWTWAQLGLHAKPIGLLGPAAFFAPLVGYLDQLVAAGFLRADHRALLDTAATPAALFAAWETPRPPLPPKWRAP